jgi:integrase
MLNELQIKAAKPAQKMYKMTDAGGLYLAILPSGVKSFRFDYKFGDKRKTLALGTHPNMSLANARKARDAAKVKLNDLVDPGAIKQDRKSEIKNRQAEIDASRERQRMIEKGIALPNSFKAIAEEWMATRLARCTRKHQVKVEQQLTDYAFPKLGNLPVDEVTAPVVLETLRELEAKGIFEVAKKTKQHISNVIKFAIATGRAMYDPVPALQTVLMPPPRTRHMAAPIEPQDFAPILRKMYNYGNEENSRCSPQVSMILKIAPHTFTRPGELRQMKWKDVDFEAREWRYLATKKNQDHIVPLSSQVIAMLRELKEITGQREYAFSGARSEQSNRPLSENTINQALKRLGIDTRNELTGHGLRAVARTILNEVHGFDSEILELQLNHIIKDPNNGAYNRTRHLQKRKQMMQFWSDYLDELRLSKNVINVNFHKAA